MVLFIGVIFVCVVCCDKFILILLIFESEDVVFVFNFWSFICVCFMFFCDISFCVWSDICFVKLFCVFVIVILLVWWCWFVVLSWDWSLFSCLVLILISVIMGLLVFICMFFCICYVFICFFISVLIVWIWFFGLSEFIVLVL